MQLQQVLPYIDIVIGNESEAEAWASATGLPDKNDLAAVAKAIALLPKSNPARPRIAIVTHGPKSTTVVSSAEPDNAKVYAVTPLTNDQIVDTNGAGDAFAGGFMGAWISGKSIDECIEVGHKMGAMCVQSVRKSLYMTSPCFSLVFGCSSSRSDLNTSGPRSKSSNLVAYFLLFSL